MWQICGHIPQTLLALPDITCIAAQLSVSFFIETFIHAKEKVSLQINYKDYRRVPYPRGYTFDSQFLHKITSSRHRRSSMKDSALGSTSILCLYSMATDTH